MDGARIEVDVERRGAYERRLTIGRRTIRTLVSPLDADLLVEVDGTAHRIARDDGGIVRNPAPAVVVVAPRRASATRCGPATSSPSSRA